MGYIRLSKLARTRRCREVIDLFGGSAKAGAMAGAAINAAEQKLSAAANDLGCHRAFLLSSQIPDATRREDFGAALRGLALADSDALTTAEVARAFTEAVDPYVDGHGARTDLGEMALIAGVETLARAWTVRRIR